jgi:translation elongation factor EF-Ts
MMDINEDLYLNEALQQRAFKILENIRLSHFKIWKKPEMFNEKEHEKGRLLKRKRC